MSQLLADCISDILKHLDRDKISLRSCLLVNRLWCNISVKILWSNVWNYGSSNYSTLIACLPDESKEILRKNGIIISPPSKPPMFNYASFCKVLSDYHIKCGIERLLKNQSIPSNHLNVKTIAQEIYKLLMNQIPSLKTLHIDPLSMNIIFTSYPGSQECMKYLSELCCRSNVCSEFFHQLSQICHNIRAICVVVDHQISDGLMDLILSQNKLKNLIFHQSHDREVLKSIIPLLETLSDNTSVKLGVYEIQNFIPLPFPKNLRELLLASTHGDSFTEDAFKELQRVIFPNLRVLIFSYLIPKVEYFNNFLERNGENLRDLYLEDSTKASNLNLSISKFCPNLKLLSTSVSEYDDLKVIFVKCQHLESIKLIGQKINVKELLDVIVNYSPKNFFKLILYYDYRMELQLLPEVLEWFFMGWSNREQQKPFSLIIIDVLRSSRFMKDCEKKKIIENYIKLGVIRKFRFVTHNEDY